ncbi:MAG: hypothetical protein JWO58_40 [Chitinophagaceae bacterium]|nr:hypothetical protein [Chitinophagaceae bacterium]
MPTLYKNLLIYFFSFALLLGPAYNTYLDYNYSNNPDCNTYMSIANGEFKDQSLIRRYRILVPFTAKVVAYPFERIYTKLWPHRATSEWPLRMGFLMVNMALMSFVGLAIFHCCKAYDISDTGSLLALIAVLVGGRWGNLFAAIPITDSLYLLVLCGVIYALKKNNYIALSLCILIGPLSKESFIFVAPFIFFLSSLSKFKQLALFAIAGSIAWTIRYVIDAQAGSSMGESLASDTGHFSYIGDSILRLASVRGLGELATVLGLFSFVLLAGFTGGKAAINSWTQHLDKIIWWFIPVILIHVLLSGEAARMIYAGAAAWGIMIGLIWDHHPLLVKVKGFFYSGQ